MVTRVANRIFLPTKFQTSKEWPDLEGKAPGDETRAGKRVMVLSCHVSLPLLMNNEHTFVGAVSSLCPSIDCFSRIFVSVLSTTGIAKRQKIGVHSAALQPTCRPTMDWASLLTRTLLNGSCLKMREPLPFPKVQYVGGYCHGIIQRSVWWNCLGCPWCHYQSDMHV